MKRTLQESLVDYELPMLEAVAEVRGAELHSGHQLTAARQLAAQLLAPASVAFALDDLSPEEEEALAALVSASGWLESHRFARHFGEVLPVGPGRLSREKPWLAPSTAAEGLWYRGLVFKGFRQMDKGLVEVVYIPEDLLALLPRPSQPERAAEREAQRPTVAPALFVPAAATMIEDVFVFLVYVRSHRVRVAPGGGLTEADRRSVETQMTQPAGPQAANRSGRLDFILHLSRATGLVTEAKGQWALNREPAQAWLLSPPEHNLAMFARLWWRDTEWNDLQHVPSLKLQPTGWKNDPLLARSALLDRLAGCQPGDWYSLAELLAQLKKENPDFQRPDGDYTTWYIHDAAGEPLMGFKHWELVEGALITYLLTGPLHWLGIVELGFAGAEAGEPTSFRLTQRVTSLTAAEGEASPVSPAADAGAPPSSVMEVETGFTMRLDRGASLLDRFQLARFAEFVGWEESAVRYAITPESLARARRQGVTADQITAFLSRVGGPLMPGELLEAVGRWQIPGMAARLEQAVLLRTENAAILDGLLDDGSLRPLLAERLGPTAVLVSRQHVQAVRQWLVRRGYLDPDS